MVQWPVPSPARGPGSSLPVVPLRRSTRWPREIRDELIRSERRIAHPAFPDSRTTASYRSLSAQGEPKALELFRMNYKGLKDSGAAKAKTVDKR